MRIAIVLLASCALLTGCGGDGGQGTAPVAGAPSNPTPTPTPTPTPSPSATGFVTGEVKPAGDATFITASMELTTTGGVSQTNGIITGGMTGDRTTTIDAAGFRARYDAGYNLTDRVNSVDFGREHLSFDSTAPNGNGVVLFTRKNGAIEDYLALYQQSTYTSSIKGSGYTTARYGGSAGWQHTVVNGNTRRTRLNYFAYGSATPAVAMPRSGVVRYSILGSGNYATDSALWFLSSSTSNFITVDFGAATVSGTVGLSGENFYRSEVGGIGSVRIVGSVNGNSVSGSFADGSVGTSGGVPGQFRMLFVGPSANEIVLTIVANDGTQAAVVAAVGVIDPYAN